jgi:glyoxylase I family protein
MPSIIGIAHVELSDRDLEASAACSMALLGLRRVGNRDDERGLTACALVDPVSGIVLALMQHDGNTGETFQVNRAGLDHRAFAVADRAELMQWQQRLAGLHADFTPLEGWAHGAAVTARGPDRIAIEFYVRGPARQRRAFFCFWLPVPCDTIKAGSGNVKAPAARRYARHRP